MGKEKNKYIPLTIDYKNRKPRQLLKKHMFVKMDQCIFLKKILNKFSNRLGGKIEVFEMDEWQSLQLDDIKQLQTMELLFKKN